MAVQPFIEKLKARRNRREAATPSVRGIRTWDDPVLKTVCRNVGPDENVWPIIERMEAAMQGIGVGLAAPQIGEAIRIILLAPPGWTPMPMINPVVVEASKEMEWGEEGCLSYPGVFAPIERHLRVTVEYGTGISVERINLEGYPARIAQHEIDHLNGICRVGDSWRKRRKAYPAAPLAMAMMIGGA